MNALFDPKKAPAGGTTALVLAGRRDGALDPLAAAAGVTHKCLVPIAGRPLLAHVLAALDQAPEIGRILVSIDDPAVLTGQLWFASGRVTIVGAKYNLVDSIVAALGEEVDFPVLVTTADNVLLTPAAITELVGTATCDWTDVAVAFATRGAVLAAHPEGQRRFYAFADDSYSNCNLYWLGSRRALDAAEVFRQGGQFAKHPRRMVGAFGLLNLIRFRFGLCSLDRLMLRLSRRFGLSIRPVVLGDGALAIDVDNQRTHAIAEELLSRRRMRLLATAA